MIRNPVLRTLLIVLILSLTLYALIDGIRYGSTAGILMSVASMGALGISIYLWKKLQSMPQEEEEA
jgi:hypothetical protein